MSGALLLSAPIPLLMLPAPITTIVSVSGGMASSYALKLALESETNVVAMFADVKGTGYSHFWSDLPSIEYLLHERYGGESRDTYRLLWQLSYALDIPIECVEDGRSIWAIAAQYRMFRLFAGKKAFCKASQILKRETLARRIEQQYKPGTYQIALGMDVLEPHRVREAEAWWRNRLGWNVRVYSPLIQHFRKTGHAIERCEIQAWMIENGIDIPDAYLNDLPHNNCNKFCFMAGQTQYAIAYELDPLGYQYAAWQEMRLRRVLHINATILGIKRNGVKRPKTLYEFIDMIERNEVNRKDIGYGCSCVAYPIPVQLERIEERVA